jgi:hypothetical protein
MPVLLTALRDYASDKFSQREVANHLNSLGYRTRKGNLFTGSAIKDVLSNRFYEGKVIYHEGQANEAVIDGCHEVSQEVRELWLQCQPIKEKRLAFTRGQPRGPARHFPFSKVLKYQRCHQPYYGETTSRSGNESFRLTQMKLVSPPPQVHHIPNLERSAEILKSMRILWSHSGVNDQQREDFIQKAFKEITIDDKQITAIEPQSNYAPLFDAVVLNPKYGYRETKSAYREG